MSASHTPVLLREVLGQARDFENEMKCSMAMALDGTFGRGGHTRALLDQHKKLQVVAFDQDVEALTFGALNFSSEIKSGRLRLIHANFQELALAKAKFDFMLFDLGVSSPQLDVAGRGFSFYHDGPLDMRMDDRVKLTAREIVNEWSEQDLARIFIESGEIQFPFKVVRAIVEDRAKSKFETTQQLAGLIERVDGWVKKGFHPATQYFMALRLEINRELEAIRRMLPEALQMLNPGGRLLVITFHSLEDRIVKSFFRELDDAAVIGQSVKRKAIQPSDEEVKSNPRSRSAKLRVFRRFLEGETKAPKNKYAHLASAKTPPKQRETEEDS